jgi:DNA-directed RNA polymerase specialized sigma24 family protein
MSPNFRCRCPICRLRGALSARLAHEDSISWYRNVGSRHSALLAIPTIRDLVAFMHEKHKGDAEHVRADAIYLGLLRDPASQDGAEIPNTLFILLFLKSLHTMVRAVSRSYPQIDPEDIAQEVLVKFLRVLRSRFLRGRTTYIGKIIAERTRRNIFRWAIRTSQGIYRHAIQLTAQEPAKASERSEDPVVLLDHFLSACLREGRITEKEAQLLRDYELAGFSGDELSRRYGLSPKALSARVRRLLTRLHDAAEEVRAKGGWPGRFLPG